MEETPLLHFILFYITQSLQTFFFCTAAEKYTFEMLTAC